MKNIEGIIEGARKVIQSHCVDGGSGYSRWIWQNATNDRELVINPYGCADAANIVLVSLNELISIHISGYTIIRPPMQTRM